MDYRQLGRSGLQVSRLCLGTMNFGPVTDEPTAHKIMDLASEVGINFVDTANVYGWGEHRGRSESIIGNWFVRGDGRRDRTVLATKVYGEMSDWPNDGRLSALHIRRACDASLHRMQTDYIDLYQMHHVDRSTPWEEIWQAMEVLVGQGKILYVGSSNFAGWHLAQAQCTAQRRNFVGLVSEQSIYNLLTREVELEVLPACQSYGLGMLPWSPLHGGLLGGVLAKEGAGKRRRSGRAAEALADARPQLERYEALCDKVGEPPAAVALAWLLHQPAVTAPIVGPRTPAQLSGALEALEITLDRGVLDELDDIFPGYRPAPEDYAW
jgi:aryl-alcohol dehydrogenase-like predicted oxidoreductase